MPIIRQLHSIDTNFTQVRNEHARDSGLSFRARGVLVYIWSMAPGWSLSINGLTEAALEGRDAIRAAITELEAAGYLEREQKRQDGRFSEMTWTTRDPSDSPSAGKPSAGKPLTKNTNQKNNLNKKTKEEKTNVCEADLICFEQFWDAYPRKIAKAKAREAYAKALGQSDPETLLLKAKQYAADPTRKDEFTKHPTTWLNSEGWLDEYAKNYRADDDLKRLRDLEYTRRMIAENDKPRGPIPICEHGSNPALCKKCLRAIN